MAFQPCLRSFGLFRNANSPQSNAVGGASLARKIQSKASLGRDRVPAKGVARQSKTGKYHLR